MRTFSYGDSFDDRLPLFANSTGQPTPEPNKPSALDQGPPEAAEEDEEEEPSEAS
jgi:hypothetical protein